MYLIHGQHKKRRTKKLNRKMGSAHCAHCAHCAHGKMKLTRLHACENQTDRPTARCFILNANFQRREASLFMASDFDASFHLN